MAAAAGLQGAFSADGIIFTSTIGAIIESTPHNNKENAMLRTFTAALIATTLVAGSAFAAQPSGSTAAAPAAAPAAASTQNAAKPAVTAKRVKTVKRVKTAKHIRKPIRHHTAHAVKSGPAKSVKSSA